MTRWSGMDIGEARILSSFTRALAGNLKLGGLEIFFQRVTGGDFLKITVYKKW